MGSEIKKANHQPTSIKKQGKRIGNKIVNQKTYWSDPTRRGKLKGLSPTASFPESPDNVLTNVDLFDVPTFEKAAMQSSIVNATSANPNNVLFLNNPYNL